MFLFLSSYIMPSPTRFVTELIVIIGAMLAVQFLVIDRFFPDLERWQSSALVAALLHGLFEILGLNAYYARTYN